MTTRHAGPWGALRAHWACAAAGVVALVAGIACGNHDSVSGPAGQLHTIVVSPSPDTLTVGGSKGFKATGQDASGRTVSGLTFFWSSSNPAVATVTQSGQVTAVGVGQAQIAASVSGVSGLAVLVVSPKPVGSIVIVPSNATLRIATTLQLTDTVKDASGNVLTGQTVTWSSDSAPVAAVDGNGLVTARALGVAHITAKAGGKSTTATITVAQVPVASVTVSPAAPSVYVGQTTQLTAVTKDSVGNVLSGRVVRWTTASAAIATIDSVAGILTGIAPGTTYIRARSEGIVDSVLATVTNAPASTVVLSPSVFQTTAGQTVSYTAVVTNSTGGMVSNPTVIYSSGNTGIASVTSESGANAQVLAGPGTGTVTITGTSSPATGHATLIVSLTAVDSVHIAAAHDTLTAGQFETMTATAYDSSGNQLTGRAVTWQSSNTSVATVNGAGAVTTVSAGVAVIFATISGVKGSLVLQVNPVPVGSVVISPHTDTVQVVEQVQLSSTVRDINGNIITPTPAQTWYSTNTSIAVVTSSGLVTGVGTSSQPINFAMIIDSVGGKADTNTTYVLSSVQTVTLNPPSASLTTAQAPLALAPTLVDIYGNTVTGRRITWTSSNAAVDTVSQSGSVYPVAPGTDTITAAVVQPTGNVSGTSVITVTQDPVASVVVYPATSTIYATSPNNTVQLHDSAYDASHTYLPGRPVTWSPTSGGNATVNAASGLVTATNTAAGQVTITATSTDGPNGSGVVTVLGHAQSVTVNPQALTLSVSSTPPNLSSTTATATVLDTFGNPVESTRQVIWQSSDPSTVTINGAGTITTGASTTVTLAAVSTNSSPITITVTAVDNAAATNTAQLSIVP